MEQSFLCAILIILNLFIVELCAFLVDRDLHHDMEALSRNGIHAVAMDERNFEPWLAQHEYVFVNFYAPWCFWSQELEPVWEAFAEQVEANQLPVSVIKVDCMENRDLCLEQKIQAFPNLRMFKHSQPQHPDYRSERTVEELLEFVHASLLLYEQLAEDLPVSGSLDKYDRDNDAHFELNADVSSSNYSNDFDGGNSPDDDINHPQHLEMETSRDVIKVDCIENRDLCMEQKIQAFPNLRMFKHSQPLLPDFSSDTSYRTVEELLEFVHARLSPNES